MTVRELANQLGITPQAIHGIIKRNNLPKGAIRQDGSYHALELPQATVKFIIAFHERRTAEHGLMSPVVEDFFRTLLMIRRKAGQPINVGVFMEEYRKLTCGFHDE